MRGERRLLRLGWFTTAIIYLLLVTTTASTARHDRPIATAAR
jgi:hypothetical protein